MPGYDASVRDNLVLQLALAEDIAGIRGVGTQFTPKGLKGFCQKHGLKLNLIVLARR